MTSFSSRDSNPDQDHKQLRSILPIFAPIFIDNFTINDVKLKPFFSKAEIDNISGEKEGERQTFSLLSVLERKSEYDNDQFVESLESDYKFIKSAIMSELSQPSQSTLNFLKAKMDLLNIDQKFIDYNVRRTNDFCELRKTILKLNSSSMMRNIIIRGNLGAGKKWLALDVLTEFTVLKALNFKVYWLDVKSCTSEENTLVKLQELRHLVDPLYRFSSLNEIEKTIAYQQTMLKRLFEDKNDSESLVVLVDVQNKKALKSFTNIGCKLLVLTRYERVSRVLSLKTTTIIELNDELTYNEIENLFTLYIQPQCKESLRSRIKAIYQKTQNPLKLSFIASVLPVSDWDHWEKNNFNKLTQIVESSLNVLNVENQHYFAALLIFPEDAEIPIELLTSLWNVTTERREEILAVFKKNSLVKHNAEKETIALSNIYSVQLSKSQKITDMINKRDLHEKVVQAFNIDKVFDQREDPELETLPKYFFCHIIHHLTALEEVERDRLFKKILLDFGFLEKKIRLESNKILNTLQQLNYYKKQDYCGKEQRKLIHEFCQFLPKVEEKLMLSSDTCLLQYGLMENGALHMEAVRQMQLYPKQVWLTETGSFHQRRQLVQVGKQVRNAIYLDSEECLVVLDNHEIMLVNLSLEHDTGNIQLENKQEIQQLLVFNRQKDLITLNKYGQLNLFSLNTNRPTSGTHLMHRQSSKKKVPDFKPISQKAAHFGKPRAPKWTFKYDGRKRIVAIHINEQNNGKIDLYVACVNGDVHPFEWIHDNDETVFRPISSLPIATKLKDESEIRFVSKLLNQFILVLSNNGTISIWRIQDTSEVYKRAIANAGKVIHMTTYDINHKTKALFVFSHKVFEMDFPRDTLHNELDLKQIYEQPCNEESIVPINCAKVSYDKRYLLLGTEKGLTVVDLATQLSVLCSNVSERIACVDISCLDPVTQYDPNYIVLCGAVGNTFLHLYAIKTPVEDKKITWLHHVECMANKDMQNNIARLEPDVRWRGDKLYDVTYGDAGEINLLAVDSKNRIHQVITTDKPNWMLIPQESKCDITAVTAFGVEDHAFVGYNDGRIFNVNKEHYLQQNFLTKAIDYLHLLDENILIASSYVPQITLIVRKLDAQNLSDDDYIKLDFFCKQVYKVYEHYLLLIGSDALRYIDLNQQSIHTINDDIFSAWDYQQSVLFLATNNDILIYRFTNSEDQLRSQGNSYRISDAGQDHDNVNCLAASKDGSLIALGYRNGNIMLYKHHDSEITFINVLESHKHKIMEMRFSPEKDVLVSCAEQICFWNVNYILNNESAISRTTQRRSSRFSVQRSVDENGTEEVDAMPVHPYARHLPVGNEHNDNLRYAVLSTCRSGRSPWHQKQGHASKPQLFACIKFDGNEAVKFFANADFTQFDMIDNEGVYYQLRLLDSSTMQLPISTHNLDSDDVFYSLERSIPSDINIERDIGNGTDMEHTQEDEDDGGVDVVNDLLKSCNSNISTKHDVDDDGQEEEGATALPLAV